MAGALNGVRVVDFGQYIAGPMAAMFLADQGADVVRIDPPGGPRWDTPANATWNRGKRSIVLDLKLAADLETARRLIGGADVVVENFRPGAMERLGVGPDAMTAANPRLVYCSMPGFASDDPRAGVAAWKGVVGAATATYRQSASQPTGLDDPSRPVYCAIPVSSAYAAFQGAVSIAMALVARESDGRGQRIEVPLFDATFAAIGLYAVRAHEKENPRVSPGGWPREFQCKDGRWVWFQSANQNFRQFVEAAGITSWDDEGLEVFWRLVESGAVRVAGIAARQQGAEEAEIRKGSAEARAPLPEDPRKDKGGPRPLSPHRAGRPAPE